MGKMYVVVSKMHHRVHWRHKAIWKAAFKTFRDFGGLTPSDIPARLRGAVQITTKNPRSSELDADFCYLFAEGKGFEPLRRRRLTVFKTAAIDHSANLPDWEGKDRKLFGF